MRSIVSMPTTTCAPSSSPAPGGVLRRRRLSGGGETFARAVATIADRTRRSARRRRAGLAADLRVHEAGDRGDQRAGGRRRHHDDAADGHPPGQRDAPSSGSCSPGAASCRRRARRGSCRGWSASARRRSGATPAGVPGAAEALAGGWCAASTRRTNCCPRRGRSPPRSPTTPRRSASP